MNVVLVGATGYIGRALCRALIDRGDAVTAFVRDAAGAARVLPDAVALEHWNPKSTDVLVRGLAEAGAAINLAGEGLTAARWTPDFKGRLISSRVETTRTVVRALAEAANPRCVLVNASAIGYYGDCGEREVDEEAPPGRDFLARLCVEWESATKPAAESGTRVVVLRSGIVLGPGGGALEAIARPFRFMAGGPLGSGRQWVSWIGLEDELRMVLWALDTPAVSGPLNSVAPEPVRNRDLARELGHVMGRPAIAPVPAFVLRTVLGELAETLLTGQRVRPGVATRLGFEWRRTDLRETLAESLAPRAAGGGAPGDH